MQKPSSKKRQGCLCGQAAVGRVGQGCGLARYRADLVLDLVQINALLGDDAADDDKKRLDRGLFHLWKLRLKIVQKRCDIVLLVVHTIQTSNPSFLFFLSSNQG